jgi:hypothetical protein
LNGAQGLPPVFLDSYLPEVSGMCRNKAGSHFAR